MTTTKNLDRAFHDFAEVDAWGRAVGAIVLTWEDEAERFAAYPFGLRVQATRKGVSYGPAQAARYFATVGERDKAVAKYLKGAAKNAVKIAARGKPSQRGLSPILED